MLPRRPFTLSAALALAGLLASAALVQPPPPANLVLVGGQPKEGEGGSEPQQTHLVISFDPQLRVPELPCLSTSTAKLPVARGTAGKFNPDPLKGDVDALVSLICDKREYAAAGQTVAFNIIQGGEVAKSAAYALKQARQQPECKERDVYALLEAAKHINQGVAPYTEVFQFAQDLVRAADAVGIQLCVTATWLDPRSGRVLNETPYFTTGEIGRRR